MSGEAISLVNDEFLMQNNDEKVEHQFHQLREQVKRMLIAAVDKPSTEKINLIDAIQRLGVSYHFQSEIDELLQYIHMNYKEDLDKNDHDLYTTALCFRILRQHGYNVSCSK